MPQLSIIIPTYEGHHKYVQEAVDSVGFELAEIIIVNDSEIPLEVEGNNIYVINRNEPGRWGTGKARNIGANEAHTDLLLWMDSDDLYLPNGVRLLYEAQRQTVDLDHPDGIIVYGGFLRGFDNAYWAMQDQYCGTDIMKSGLVTPAMPYCILIPKVQHELIEGYDEAMPTWEDIDYEKKITVAGLCAHRINSVVFWYRWESGIRRNLSDDPVIHKAVSDHMYAKYKDYHEGRKPLSNCNTCGNAPASPYKTVNKTDNLPAPQALSSNERLFLVYIGGEPVHNKPGPVTTNTYRWGKSSRSTHYRKLVVDKTVDLRDDEVNRLDAEQFILIRRGGISHEFKYDIEIVVGNAPVPLPTKRPMVVESKPKGMVENPDIGFLYEQGKPVGEFSIPAMTKEIASGTVFKSQLQTWLEQEERSEKPRKGMLDVLNEAIKSI